jgi:hypothetical protein
MILPNAATVADDYSEFGRHAGPPVERALPGTTIPDSEIAGAEAQRHAAQQAEAAGWAEDEDDMPSEPPESLSEASEGSGVATARGKGPQEGAESPGPTLDWLDDIEEALNGTAARIEDPQADPVLRGDAGTGNPADKPTTGKTARRTKPTAAQREAAAKRRSDAVAADAQSSSPPTKRPTGRPPAHPRLTAKDDSTMELLAERALGLSTNLIVLEELDCTRDELVRFLRRRPIMAALQRKVLEVRQSGEMARKMANAGLSHGVERMTEIVKDREMGPSAAIGAAGVLSKVASTNGRQEKARADTGPNFSITINLGGEDGEALQVTTGDIIEGEYADD